MSLFAIVCIEMFLNNGISESLIKSRKISEEKVEIMDTRSCC